MRSFRAIYVSRPPPRRLAVILALGAAAMAAAAAWRSSVRPRSVPREVAEKGLAEARAVIDAVRASDFGRSERGSILTTEVERFLEGGRVVFTADIAGEALYRKEPGAAPVLYVGVYRGLKGHPLPGRDETAERLYHEALHSVKRSASKTLEEECDAYCAAEEARAAVEGRAPAFPLERDGRPLREWVAATYRDATPDPAYAPVGGSPEDLAAKAGMRGDPAGAP